MYYPRRGNQIYIGSINTSDIEIRDLLKAWAAISLAFAIVLNRFPNLQSLGFGFFEAFIIAAVTVGTGFLLHELGHKIVAQKYGCFAEFRSFDQMLIFAVLISLLGIVIAAPGAVMINGPVGVKRNGKISAAGPVVNIGLAILFMLVFFMVSAPLLQALAFYGFFINSWLALFNMIPVWNLDGAKVLRWDKKVFGAIVGAALMLLFLQNFISISGVA